MKTLDILWARWRSLLSRSLIHVESSLIENALNSIRKFGLFESLSPTVRSMSALAFLIGRQGYLQSQENLLNSASHSKPEAREVAVKSRRLQDSLPEQPKPSRLGLAVKISSLGVGVILEISQSAVAGYKYQPYQAAFVASSDSALL